MEATQLPHNEETTTLGQIGLFVGIGIAILLFLFIVGRMGLFNRILTNKAAVTSADLVLITKDMAFGLTEIKIESGQPVTFQLDNNDLYAHSFDIDALNIHIPMAANSTDSTAFTFENTGTYTFYCGVPGHQEAGMVGTIIVE